MPIRSVFANLVTYFHFNHVENREDNVKQVSVKVTNHETSYISNNFLRYLICITIGAYIFQFISFPFTCGISVQHKKVKVLLFGSEHSYVLLLSACVKLKLIFIRSIVLY